MKISTKGRYALCILLDIAMHQGNGCVAMKDIARRQQISKKYADQLAMQLTQNGVLQGSRGHQGGYRLIREPSELTVLQIVRMMEGSLAPVACMDVVPNQCSRCDYCLTLPIWQGLDRVVTEYLGSITLQDVIDQGAPQPEDLENQPAPDCMAP